MNLQQCQIQNFGSYKSLEFNFSNLGLTLVHGDTGSGKSTLLDAPCWILYGRTAKGGTVDEIRSWYNLNSPTIGILTVGLLNGTIEVSRIRGARSHENDLYWVEADTGEIHRGKDITETQELLNKRMGFDFDSYLAASYFCEYSAATSFFISTPKQQRELFELLTPLKLPELLAERAGNERKEAKKQLAQKDIELAKIAGRADQIQRTREASFVRYNSFNSEKRDRYNTLQEKVRAFDQEKSKKIEQLRRKENLWLLERDNRVLALKNEILKEEGRIEQADYQICRTCGNCKEPIEHYKHNLKSLQKQLDRIYLEENPFIRAIKEAESQKNHAIEELTSLENSSNPYEAQLNSLVEEEEKLTIAMNLMLKEAEHLKARVSSLTQLYDISFELRADLLNSTLESMQSDINTYLKDYYEGKFTVYFKIEEGDKLITSIYNNDIVCNYRQLSKGQRSILKLSFAAATMKISSNNLGKHFDNLFFDEALDGQDEKLKLKSFSLLEHLSLHHGSILVVDHSEYLKSMFHNKFKVTLGFDSSTLIGDAEES